MRSSGTGGNAFESGLGSDAGLDHLDQHVLAGLVVQANGPVEPPSFVVSGAHVAQEVGGRAGGVVCGDHGPDVPKLGGDENRHRRRAGADRGRGGHDGQDGGEDLHGAAPDRARTGSGTLHSSMWPAAAWNHSSRRLRRDSTSFSKVLVSVRSTSSGLRSASRYVGRDPDRADRRALRGVLVEAHRARFRAAASRAAPCPAARGRAA